MSPEKMFPTKSPRLNVSGQTVIDKMSQDTMKSIQLFIKALLSSVKLLF